MIKSRILIKLVLSQVSIGTLVSTLGFFVIVTDILSILALTIACETLEALLGLALDKLRTKPKEVRL